ncbi:MAG: formylglycine-generating enzyme family protein [Bryobacteraceae bacterium]|jgi:formylglycine-generating enzyme required for sulfatase activity
MRKRLVLLMVALGAMAQAPREFTNSVGMKFVRIDPGSFKMGSGDFGPVHDVTLSKGFYLQATEVTQAQWQAVMGTNPSRFKGPDRPVEQVSWDDIQEFLGKLNAREKDTRYRLPTEAEWEYGCRAGGREPDKPPNLDDVAWWLGSSEGETHPVGRKKPNAWGLYDMWGNVWEWVRDWHGQYPAERQVDPQGPPSGAYRVLRGGAWGSNRSLADSSCRIYESPLDRFHFAGFRCARTF